MAQQVADWNLPYHFKKDNTVVISHAHRGNIRVSPRNNTKLDGGGANGEFARWIVHLANQGFVKIQNESTGKYIRIWQRGNEIDCEGGGGPFCLFKIHKLTADNEIKLESERFPGKFIAMKKNLNIKIGSGGKMCVLTFWRQNNKPLNQRVQQQARPQQVPHHPPGRPNHIPHPNPHPQPVPQRPVVNNNNNGKFDTPYHFFQNKRVVIGGPHGNTLRVSPKNTSFADGQGQHGGFAHWDVIVSPNNLVQLKSAKTGGYLRIYDRGTKIDVQGVANGKFTYFKRHQVVHGSPHIVKLQSNEFQSAYVAIPQDFQVVVGRGGPHCKLTFLKQGGVQQGQPVRCPVQQQINNNRNNNNNVNIGGGGGKFDAAYLFKMNNRVVIRGPHGKHLRIQPRNLSFADGAGGNGEFAQWDVIVHPGNIIQLRSCKTGDYLRIHDNGRVLDVQGKGGDFTYFTYHVMQARGRNVVKLSSKLFPRCFVSIPMNNSASVGSGIGSNSENCVLTFMRRSAGGNIGNNNNGNIAAPMGGGIGNTFGNFMNQIEGAMENMSIGGGYGQTGSGIGGGPLYAQQAQERRTCPLCGGKGHYGTFGWCDSSSIHKKGDCILCQAKGWVYGEYDQCAKCGGKGCQGVFGACDRWDIHYRNDCRGCEGYGYLRR